MTAGQRLYEKLYPTHILVVPFEKRKYATSNDAFLTPNPEHVAPWRLISRGSQEIYERLAIGHILVQEI
jgi:hypothetical protein